MPKKITTNWELTDDPTKYRSEVELSAFDVHGNPIEMIDPSGFKTERIYYPKEADPNGFVRFLKETTVTPSPIGRVGAPTLCTRYTYRKMPPLAGSDLKEWMTVESETLLEMDAGDEKVLQLTERTYADVPEEPFLHGRPLSQRVTLNDMPSLTEFAYRTINSTLAGDAVLETIETFTGFDHGVDGKEVQKITREQHSLATGKPVVKSDINNVQTLIVYDALGRVTRETVAPDEPDDTASRHYDYFLTSIDGQQASQVVTDVKGIRTLTRFDGLNRTIYVGRQDIENPIHADDYRQTYAAEFDALGNLFRESRFDWIDAEQLELSSEFAYSAWGEQSRETGSDGIAVITELSPFGKLGPTSRSWTESTDQPPKVSGLSVSEYNCFGKVDVIKRFDTQRLNEQLQATLGADDKPNVALYLNTLLLNEELPTVGSTSYVYDGHGNCTQQNELLSHTERSTVFEYDKWARMVSTTLPDQTNVRRTYAQHSSAELPVSLQVVPGSSDEPTVTIGQQTFDGLSRLTALEVGPRIEQYRYNAGQMQFYQRLTPSDRTIDYTYRLNLTEQPILIKSAEDTMSYVYDEISASITNTTNNQGSLRFEYNSLGNVFRENWTDASGVEHKTLYGTSLLGRLLSQSHTDGPETVYTYDSHGRTVSATQGSLSADFEYNSLGQACRTTTKSLKDGNTLVTDMFYDTLGREVVREMRLTGHVPRTILQTWYDDDQLRTRHLLKGKQSLLKEEFLYDSRSRLIQHTCSGDTLPRDVFGNAITKQVFRFDAKDNIKHCTTTFKDGKRDVAVFSYALDDSCQLIEVTHTFTEGGYTARQKFEYDADGNMLNDEQGQRLRYDSLGRLLEVKDSGDQQFISRYRYNGHNHLIGVRQGEKSETLRFYQGYNLSYTRQDDRQTHFLFLDNLPLGEQQANHDEAMLLLCDASPSVIGESLHGVLRTAVYSVYGERSANDGELQSVLAFNAEVREETTGWYLLGRGYRAYNPGLMRFHSPDSLSPFGAGGINPYVYCLGNPVFFRDPTGHRPAINRPENPGYTDPYEQPKRSFWEKFLPAAGALLGFIFAATMVPWTAGASVALFLGITGAVLTGGAVIASVYGALKEDDSAIVIGQWLGIAGAVFGAAGAITGKVMAHFATKAAGTAAAASSAGAGTGAGAGVPAAGVPAAGVPAASAGSVATAVPAAGVSNVGTQTQRPAATPPPSPTPGPIETRSSISSIDSAHTTRRNSITDATDTRSSRDSGNVKVRPGIRALINRDNENMKNNVVTSTDSKEVYLTSSTFLQHR
ncbi:RHS repeat-associated core domain-containing protein [Pseudomonas sp. C32]|uniref:RHS repeat-associated core domain-containing protein n=1 Tax=Pseudomonas sp. C32 TaxID=1529208 RepID=UPI002636937F|nr:RHS repeat-associated core domain-containing protein [Pseudomonas sp. C32]MDN4548024.1 RHS repeat-associated core domain-containing protein [Pseudomonas sp. C32]